MDPKLALDELAKLRESYQSDRKQQKINILLEGESGSGKTYILRTARLPIHVDSFDPGGTKSLRAGSVSIESGDIIVDTKYELENPKDPSAFHKWTVDFDRRLKSGYFDQFGTYVLDSSTMFSEAIMNYVLKQAGRAGQTPQRNHDYVPQKTHLTNNLKQVLNLPCDVILTGHLKAVDDPVDVITINNEVQPKTIMRFLAVGQAMTTIPLLFDEIWITSVVRGPEGLKYRLILESTGTYLARSRLLGNLTGKKEPYYEADIKKTLRLCGYPVEDKPKLGA